MATTDLYLGRAGALVKLPPVGPGWEPAELIRGGTHELPFGSVRDRAGTVRRWVLPWKGLTDDEWSQIRTLARLPGPYRLLDPRDRNRLTVNQSTGTDELRDPTGMRAVGQGSVTSDAAFAHAGLRSLLWDSGTALAATGRGVSWSTSTSVESTWTAVRPSVAHSFSVWARASVSVTLAARIDWYSAAGALISSDTGTAAAVSTTWAQLTCANKTSPASAAYAVCGVRNTTTTGAATQVWLDDAQVEENSAVNSWQLGGGTPLVAVESVTPTAQQAGWTDAELVLLELG